MSHNENVTVSVRYNREEGNNADYSIGSVIGLAGAATAALVTGNAIKSVEAGLRVNKEELEMRVKVSKR